MIHDGQLGKVLFKNESEVLFISIPWKDKECECVGTVFSLQKSVSIFLYLETV